MRSLAVVGQDCECGLDRRWMQGPMVPHRWTTMDEKVAIEKLGFDPGNPLVKAEIDQILTRGPGADGSRQVEFEDSLKIAPALSYQEIALDDLTTQSAPQKSSEPSGSEQSSAVGSDVARNSQSESTSDPAGEFSGDSEASLQVPEGVNSLKAEKAAAENPPSSPSGRWSYLFLIGSALLVVVIGLLILMRSGEAAA